MGGAVLQDELEALVENTSLPKWEEGFCRDIIHRLELGWPLTNAQTATAREIINNYS